MTSTVGQHAAPVAGATVDGPHALVFYKVTCSVTQMAGPPIARLAEAYPDHVVGVGQDPLDALARFADEYGWAFPQVSDPPPYPASGAYGIVSAPTVIVVDGERRVAAVAESWDREAMNAASGRLAGLLGVTPVLLSEPGDGLPSFKPG